MKKAVSREKRREIISFVKEVTKSNRKVAELVGVSEKCVRETKNNFILIRESPGKPISGRPLATTSHNNRVIFRDVRIDPRASFKEISSCFNIFGNKPISLSTVRRLLSIK